MPDENTPDEILAASPKFRFVSGDQSPASLANAIGSLDAIVSDRSGAGVVIAEPGARSGAVGFFDGVQTPRLIERRVVARCSPMTDAIKRVDGSLVVETVDREQLRVVELPMVLPIALAKRWAAAVLDGTVAGGGEGPPEAPVRRITAAGLLSQLVLIEPDLQVVGFEVNS